MFTQREGNVPDRYPVLRFPLLDGGSRVSLHDHQDSDYDGIPTLSIRATVIVDPLSGPFFGFPYFSRKEKSLPCYFLVLLPKDLLNTVFSIAGRLTRK